MTLVWLDYGKAGIGINHYILRRGGFGWSGKVRGITLLVRHYIIAERGGRGKVRRHALKRDGITHNDRV